MARILFYVQHILGVGHQTRAAAIARALRAAGLEVTYVTGGSEDLALDLNGATIVQLPPTRATDASFKTLVDENGHPIDANWEQRRRSLLLETFQNTAPDAVLIEGYPFARRRFQFELLPLLKAAKARGTPVAISVRDILVQKKNPDRVQETIDIVNTYCTTVLVHGDPAFIAFDETFPAADAIADKIQYTGYISSDSNTPNALISPPRKREGVVVSVGGGAVGAPLVRAALAARPLTRFRDAPWRIITGPNFPKSERLKLSAPEGVTLETFSTRFRDMLAQSALSVSQAGYNTIMDLLATETPAVLAPFSQDGETEQSVRAKLLANEAGFNVVSEAALTPSRLARAIDETALKHAPDPSAQPSSVKNAIRLNGASETAHRMVDLVALTP
ncbi:MAG: glycosyl transferase [Alphaproteobacteria bacterium]|nr:glycosyl transferase [Alphaproteobacteria bacterium]